MDKLYSSNISDLAYAFGVLLDAPIADVKEHEQRLRELSGQKDKVMFGHTVGSLADMCLKRLESL